MVSAICTQGSAARSCCQISAKLNNSIMLFFFCTSTFVCSKIEVVLKDTGCRCGLLNCAHWLKVQWYKYSQATQWWLFLGCMDLHTIALRWLILMLLIKDVDCDSVCMQTCLSVSNWAFCVLSIRKSVSHIRMRSNAEEIVLNGSLQPYSFLLVFWRLGIAFKHDCHSCLSRIARLYRLIIPKGKKVQNKYTAVWLNALEIQLKNVVIH